MSASSKPPTPQFPNHAGPRVWFITSASSPSGLAVAEEVLRHGDFVVAGDEVNLSATDDQARREDLVSLWNLAQSEGWEDRFRKVRIDARYGSWLRVFDVSLTSPCAEHTEQEPRTMSSGRCESH